MTVIDEDNAPNTTGGMLLGCLFSSCSSDPKGSVHRAWSITVLFTLVFFGIAILETLTLKDTNASLALKLAAVWTTILQLVVIVVGTFIIKRYSTSFSVGFLLGMVIVISQQHLLVGITFAHTSYGNWFENAIFSNMSFALFAFYFLFAIILMQFKTSIMIAAVDAKGFRRPTFTSGGD